MSAPEKELSELHALLAKVMKVKLSDPESLTSGDLSVIRQFLKDNGINADGERDPTLKSIADELPDLDSTNVVPYGR